MYKSVLMHLHSILEGGTPSIAGYCHEARRFGIDAVWISDHDSRFFGGVQGVHEVSLENGGEFRTLDGPCAASLVKNSPRGGGLALRARSGDARWRGASFMLPYIEKRCRPPLISRPKLELRLKTAIGARSRNRRLVLRLHLSQVPPEHQPVFVDYRLGGGPLAGKALSLPLDGGVAEINILGDCERLGLDADHNLAGVEILLESRSGCEARLEIESMKLRRSVTDPQELLKMQASLGWEIGDRFGVEVLVGYEASGADGHMTCFGPPLPIPYVPGSPMPMGEIARRIVARGGVVSINHPFSKWKREKHDEARREELLAAVASGLGADGCHGAHLIEVGFPEGRHNFGVEYYLRLLDLLNLAGRRIAAIGVSDAHGNRGWDDGNNFANYLAAPDCRRENLVAAMKAGNFYLADPARVRGGFSIVTDRGKTMGDRQPAGFFEASMEGIPRGSEWRWIADGHPAAREVTGTSHQSRFDLGRASHFVRAELWDTYGRLVLAANPLWTGRD